MNLEKFDKCKSWLCLHQLPEYKGAFQIGCWGRNCRTDTAICATVDGSTCDPFQEQATVYICPGEDVHLWWVSSDDVTEVNISPDIGAVDPSAHLVVNPTETTDYTITVNGDCERSSTVHVFVVEPGSEIDLIYHAVRQSHPHDWYWEISIPISRCSENIETTSITPLCALGCFRHDPPLTDYLYLSCGDLLCNGEWGGLKENIDGHLVTFNVSAVSRLDLPDIPLVGRWEFTPQYPSDQPYGNAYFRLTARYRT